MPKEYNEGYQASIEGKLLADNPHRISPYRILSAVPFDDWNRGWKAADDDLQQGKIANENLARQGLRDTFKAKGEGKP